MPQECHGFTLTKGWGQGKQGWVVANSPVPERPECDEPQSNNPPERNTQCCCKGVAGVPGGCSNTMTAPAYRELGSRFSGKCTGGSCTVPAGQFFPSPGEAPSNSVLLQKSHISDRALNTKFLTVAGDAKWLTEAVIWGLQWCLLLTKHPCHRAQGWGWGEWAAGFDENRSRGSDEHIGVRVRIWLYLLTRMTWLFNWILWWLCSSALKKTSCLILQQSNARAIALYLRVLLCSVTLPAQPQPLKDP